MELVEAEAAAALDRDVLPTVVVAVADVSVVAHSVVVYDKSAVDAVKAMAIVFVSQVQN